MPQPTAKSQKSSRIQAPQSERSNTHHAQSTVSRSREDLMKWAVQLITGWGFRHEAGLHLIQWFHDTDCALNPDHTAGIWNRCTCLPDGLLIVNFMESNEIRIPVVLDGMPVKAGRSSWQ